MFTFDNIKDLLENPYLILGDRSKVKFDNIAPVDQANSNSLTWMKKNNSKKEYLLTTTRSNIIITHFELKNVLMKYINEKVFILVEDPKLTFIKIAKALFIDEQKVGIHTTSVIDSNAIIGKNVFIGPYCYIGNIKIGDNCRIMGNNVILDRTIIGNNVIINPGTVIGSEGFGYQRNPDKTLEKFPHFGGVIIEDDVEIGSNTCIDRGTLGNTIIKKGTKIDNLVHIAHNVEIGAYCLIIANSMIGGSTKIGNYSWVAPSASLINGIEIGNDCTIGMGAVLVKSVPENQTWAGVPARPLEEFIRLQKKLKEL